MESSPVPILPQINPAMWLDEVRQHSVVKNWDPVFVYQSAKRTVELRWAKIQSADTLRHLSCFAERVYLSRLAAGRDKAVQECVAAGMRRDDAELEYERELCRIDLYYLAKFVLGYDRMEFHLHYPMCQAAEQRHPGQRSLRQFPRDTFKSTIYNVSKHVQMILRNPNISILIISNQEDNAALKLKEAKNHFIRNDKMRRLFPELCTVSAGEQGGSFLWNSPGKTRVQAEGTLSAAGVGGAKTGTHYDHICGDDYWDEKSVTSAELVQKTRDSMSNIEYLLASPSIGTIMWVSTRFAFDDPTPDLERDTRTDTIIVSGVLPNGRSLFPRQLALRTLMGQSSQNFWNFMCQIMLNPTERDAGFKKEWFRYRSWAETQKLVADGKLGVRTVLLCDYAASAGRTSDYFATVVWAIFSDNTLMVLEVIRSKVTVMEYLTQCFNLADKYRCDTMVRQNQALESIMAPQVDDMQRDRRLQNKRTMSIVIHKTGNRPKPARIKAMQPLYQEGRIYHNSDPNSGVNGLEAELLSFPASRTNDDAMDAAAMIVDRAVSYPPRAPDGKPKLELYSDDMTSEDRYRRRRAFESAQMFDEADGDPERYAELAESKEW
jgi:predicted phage terminase large subunit-like protein